MRPDIAAAALSFCGVPFAHQGRQPRKGLDCIGVWVCAVRACGIPIIDWKGYARFPRASDLTTRMEAQFDVVSEPEPGDAVQIRWPRVQPRHLGVCIGGGHFVHVYENGVVMRDVLSAYRVHRYYRVRAR